MPRPRTAYVKKLKERRCARCGSKLNSQRKRCKRCGQGAKRLVA